MSELLDARLAEMIRDAHADPRTADELVASFLMEADEFVAWDAVSILHRRGTRDVLDAARSLCRSPCVVERVLGANILGQLGVPKRTFPDECLVTLRDLLGTEEHASVLRAACIALGHLSDERAVPDLCRLASHPDARVRYGVAFALVARSNPPAIRTLIGLTDDADEQVRDWATCALGWQVEVDSPEVRAALVRRLTDPDEATRGEALTGLARRRDERVIEPLIRELRSHASAKHDQMFAVEAAILLADPRLLPALESARAAAGEAGEQYDDAIAACTPTREGA